MVFRFGVDISDVSHAWREYDSSSESSEIESVADFDSSDDSNNEQEDDDKEAIDINREEGQEDSSGESETGGKDDASNQGLADKALATSTLLEEAS